MSYLRWAKVPYAGEKKPPANPVDPLAGTWPTVYLQNRQGIFRDLRGNRIHFNIKDPETVDWEAQLKEVQKTLRGLTKRQSIIAKYWGSGVATKQWTPIIDRLIDTYEISPPEAARLLSIVQAGINDTFVVTWHYKYLWDVARPNQYDRTLATLLCTPRFPTYVSGHAAISGCTEVILSYFFPAEAKKLNKFAEENAISRVYAGVHFPIDSSEGLKLGRKIGGIVIEVIRRQRNGDGEPIEVPIRKNFDAKLPPPPYRQVIPFRFSNSCTSKIIPKAKKPVTFKKGMKPSQAKNKTVKRKGIHKNRNADSP
ncbi:vanadium-dependent haloperoxidase [Aneurinibacillus sp. Ricciae_BoGa-3]|uniref:vanadium-dependent haloperoxidase n=1 Tax=Aneurinibacillus sp. Ricciae_BoGa-3 TaxID=3022697 RepID=UPI0023413287|nr:vanadium-dependent haloperoxidase [Aneurinibacillus sp. Ricciae_BoGa-3]WCK56373.1 vanadium-dependent haloperoxidase [Aneurinibacillus sp. Ricciae_BoGa-3]